MFFHSEFKMGLKAVLVVLLVVCIVGDSKKQSRKIFRYSHFEACPGHKYKEKHFEVKYFTNQVISVDRQVINSAVEFRNVPPKPQMTVTAVKCESLEYATCVDIWSFKFDVCSKLQENSIFYSQTVNLFHPQFKCPIKDGVYRSANYTGNPEELYKFLQRSGFTSLTDYYIGVRVMFFDNKKSEFGCLDARGKFYDIKAKDIAKQ